MPYKKQKIYLKKRISTACLSLFLFFLCLCSGVNFSAKAAVHLPNKTGFLWGVNGHHRSYAGYPERNLEQQIRLAAEMGSKIYRFNFNPTNADEFTYLDKVVALCDKYGMELMLVMDRNSGTISQIKQRFFGVADRYNGKKGKGRIPYIQIFNEMDIGVLLKKYPTGAPDGSSVNHYNTWDLDEVMGKFQAALDGINEADHNTKTIINISYLHYGMITYFQSKGLKWDIIGIDWYSNMGAYSKILTPILSGFTHDIFICETNLWPSSTTNHNNAAEWKWLTDSMAQIYNMNLERIKGMVFYELLDESAFESGNYNREAHFGMVYCDRNGNIGDVKPIYTTIQQMIFGDDGSPDFGPLPSPGVSSSVSSSAAFSKVSSPAASSEAGISSQKAASRVQVSSKSITPSASQEPDDGESEEEINAELEIESDDEVISSASESSANSSAKKTAASRTDTKKSGPSKVWAIILCAVGLFIASGAAAYVIIKKTEKQKYS